MKIDLPSLLSIENIKGIDKETGRTLNDIKDEEESEFLNKYQELIRLYGDCDTANTRMILYLKREKNISISQESILTADIGMPQLAMHSSFETIGSEDTKHMFNLMSSFFKTVFKIDNDKITFLNPGKASKIL